MMMMMMMNWSQVQSFTLAAYFDSGVWRYLYFVLLLLLYVMIVVSNVSLIVLICVNRSLHEPMFMFLCSLFANELYGSSGLFPFLLLQVLADVHQVSAPLCFLQIFCVHSYGAVEYLNLAVMSYDRYVAICRPLQYNSRMTCSQTVLLVALTWLYPLLSCCFYMLFLNRSVSLCGNVINKVYCDGHSVIKLSCSDTLVINVYGLLFSFGTILAASFFIVYTYVRILLVCFSGSKQTRQKAASTCTPHLASLLNFSAGASFELLQSRFQMNNIPSVMRIFLSLYFLTCPPLFNALVYGLKLSKIRLLCKTLLTNINS